MNTCLLLSFFVTLNIPLGMDDIFLILLDKSLPLVLNRVDLFGDDAEPHELVNLLFRERVNELFLQVAQQVFEVELRLLENYVVQVLQELRVDHL